MSKLNINRLFAMILCCIIFLLCGCDSAPHKYKRISFDSEALAEELTCISENTAVVYNATETTSTSVPIYEIEEHTISDEECQQLMENLDFPSNPYKLDHKGNSISISLTRYTDSSRGYFELTEKELETLAWETFEKIPFMAGEYEYGGVRGELSVEGNGTKFIKRIMVCFYPVLDGSRVIGDNECEMWFDGSGLVEINIKLYDFKKTGMMDVVPLEDAQTKIKTPDDFAIDDTFGVINTLTVDSVKMYLVNQHSRECEILQPMYTFYGTAIFDSVKALEFKSCVVAIPEEMTYEE